MYGLNKQKQKSKHQMLKIVSVQTDHFLVVCRVFVFVFMALSAEGRRGAYSVSP